MGVHKTKVTGFRIEDSSILEKLSIIANENCRTRNKEVEYALKKYVNDWENKNGEIKVKINNIANIEQHNGTINM